MLQGFPFLFQQIKDCINLHQTRNLIFSLCRWNERLANQIVAMIFTAIHKFSDVSAFDLAFETLFCILPSLFRGLVSHCETISFKNVFKKTLPNQLFFNVFMCVFKPIFYTKLLRYCIFERLQLLKVTFIINLQNSYQKSFSKKLRQFLT